MLCPYCKSGRNKVKGGKMYLEDSNADGRSRVCSDCGGEFMTAETVTHVIDVNAAPTRVCRWKPYEKQPA